VRDVRAADLGIRTKEEGVQVRSKNEKEVGKPSRSQSNQSKSASLELKDEWKIGRGRWMMKRKIKPFSSRRKSKTRRRKNARR